MRILPNETIFNFVALLLVILIISAFAGLLVLIYNFLSKWLTFLQRDNISGSEKIKQQAYEEASQIVEDARKKAMRIVEDSTIRAKASLASIENLSQQSKRTLSTQLNNLVQSQATALKSVSDELLGSYKDTLIKQKEESMHTLEEASHEIKEELLHEVDDFRELLHKETLDTQSEVGAKVKAEYGKIEKELAEYKRHQLGVIDETIYDILHDVSKRVFGKALSMEDHQELVIEALVEAKENNVFS